MSAINYPFLTAGEASGFSGQPQEANPRQSARRRTWAVIFALVLVAAPAAEAQFSVAISGGEVTITRYTGPGGAVAIPDTISNLPVTTIGEQAFYGNTNVTSVTMSNSVTSIQVDAFDYCSSLANITLSTNLATIMDQAFAASGLTNIMIPGSVTNIGNGVFGGSTNLSAINVDPKNPVFASTNGVLFSADYSTLVDYPGTGGSYTIPTNVTTIGAEAFVFSSLTNVTITSNVTSIGEEAFDEAKLTTVIVPASVTNFGDYAFALCSKLGRVNVASPVLGQEAFSGCFSLTNLTIAGNVTSLGENAFSSCSSLTNVIIPGSVTSIGEDAFTECYDLAAVTISSGVTGIGVGAFSDCTSLTGITIPATVTNIGLEAFLGCAALNVINVNSQNAFYSGTNGVLFDKNQTTLIDCPCAIGGSYTIPAGVKSVETYAFFSCTSLTNVTFPASVTNIDDHAFYYCPSLLSVFFSGNPPALDSYVFLNDNSATAYYLPGSTGWSSPFGGLPAILWNPLIEASGSGSGVISNQFEFNVTGTTNIPIVVEYCTNLANPIWTPLETLVLTKGLFHYSEAVQTNVPGRYFRISSP